MRRSGWRRAMAARRPQSARRETETATFSTSGFSGGHRVDAGLEVGRASGEVVHRQHDAAALAAADDVVEPVRPLEVDVVGAAVESARQQGAPGGFARRRTTRPRLHAPARDDDRQGPAANRAVDVGVLNGVDAHFDQVGPCRRRPAAPGVRPWCVRSPSRTRAGVSFPSAFLQAVSGPVLAASCGRRAQALEPFQKKASSTCVEEALLVPPERVDPGGLFSAWAHTTTRRRRSACGCVKKRS